jgi:ribonuclease HII/Holliday junction resolvase-like predicted endonuclease
VACDFSIENQWQFPLIAGIDEAGRGCLAGPVVAACVVLPASFRQQPPAYLVKVNDSKKVRAPLRSELKKEIEATALAVGVGMVNAQRVDEINILQATFEAARMAYAEVVKKLGSIDLALVDGNLRIPQLGGAQQPVVHGDAFSKSIAAASIVAKVTRDDWMTKQDSLFPAYGFASHKGYGTKVHREAIAHHGPCILHRQSFLGSIEKKVLGHSGEELAAQFLEASRFRVVERNWRSPLGEIDIIAESDDGLHFVEVRTRSQFTELAQIFPASKQRRLMKLAELYRLKDKKYTEEDYHIDLLCVEGDKIEPFWNIIEGV